MCHRDAFNNLGSVKLERPHLLYQPGRMLCSSVAQKGKVGLGRVANVTSIDVSLTFGDQLVRTSNATRPEGSRIAAS